MKTNYVITLFGGDRASKHSKYTEDRLCYMKKQVELLSSVQHALSLVTFVLNRSGNETEEYKDFFFRKIPPKLGNARVEKYIRPNIGISYGAFSYAYGLGRQKYDYYFFSEDDMAFIRDGWDTELIRMLGTYRDKDPNYEYICLMSYPWGEVGTERYLPAHAAMPHGCMTSGVLERIWNKYGELPNSGILGDYKHGDDPGQIKFSKAFLDVGANICDTGNWYKIDYINDGYIDHYYVDRPEEIARYIDLID